MQSKIVSLKSILSYKGLSSGYSFRGKIQHIHNGGVRVIQLKDFENNYTVIGQDCTLVEREKIKDKYFLENGDVLFIAKGTNNFSLVFEEIDNTPTIASSALFVLKVDTRLANPFYIAWYLNQTEVQNYFKSNETGTYTKSISKPILEEAPIALPSLETQNKIAQVALLHNKELAISHKIIALKNQLTTTQLLNAL
ncbi:hypothetical protein BST91_02685 [Nonlabens tegetincola]|uniref:restriction endonuclease subunit S n=1 Tax=Nonlabens tegetincola TaxID=323273 RepID=UPI000A20518D|nr:restriction endonuclease subunit S [Nonlabens tegetincola]ARN70630.1 hypothetical protein BST91_02685 [Nonlabens tegetincola]